MTPDEANERIQAAFRDPRIIQEACQRGIADALREHARAGRLVPSWKNGKVVWVDPLTIVEAYEKTVLRSPKIRNQME